MKIYKQETDKSCGIACLRSILNYYGENLSEEDVWDKHEIPQKSRELIRNPILSLGVTALKFGYDVQYFGFDPRIANGNRNKKLEDALKEKSKTFYDYGKYLIDQALEFLNLGGKISIDKLPQSRIEKLLDKHKFLLVEMRPALMGDGVSPRMNHKVILTGYTKNKFRFLNPSSGKSESADKHDFLVALYASMPEVLVIQKKK